MLVLAADTSGKYGSVALARGDQHNFQLIEMVALAGGTFSAQLVPQIADLLSRHTLGKSELDGFVVASGPGSFTGLRVGLAAIKGLAEVLHKPIAAVSLLEVLALAANSDGHTIAALDAGRAQAYVGDYEVRESGAKLVSEVLLNREEFLRFAGARSQAAIVTCDSLPAEWARSAQRAAQIVDHPLADAIARIGIQKLLTGVTESAEELDANYIRRSDAEIFSNPPQSASATPANKRKFNV